MGIESIAHPRGHSLFYEKIDSTIKQNLRIMFLGGFRSSMNGVKGNYLSLLAREKNLNFLRFDYFGCGMSSGSFQEGTIGKWIDDILFLLDNIVEEKAILVGSSMGGWLMLHAALRRPNKVAGLVGIASGIDFTQKVLWEKMTDKQRETIQCHGFIDLSPRFESLSYISYELIKEGSNHLLLNDNDIEVSVPTRLIHGMQDEIIPFDYSLQLASKLQTSDLTITLVKNSSHTMNSEYALAKIATEIMELYNSV